LPLIPFGHGRSRLTPTREIKGLAVSANPIFVMGYHLEGVSGGQITI